ncbi:2701_t:CDS:2 [Diversispora eburnea]|uniref:2701_t:CDS:1 n=1 Tax=Diversispora eburnea TaxID=1213867 RepID=A0A9N8YU51_9GLOM|nr:2701_t:CDS:2 [Diversispora eburnea]
MANATQYLEENYPSSNSINLSNLGNLEELDSSFINSGRSHSYYMRKLKKLKLSNNRITELNLFGSSNLAYFECDNNLLSELDLSNMFDCQKNTFLSQTITTTTSKKTQSTTTTRNNSVTATPTIGHLATTPTTNNNLGLKIGLSVVGIIAIFLLGLVTFLCYKYRVRRQVTQGTPVLQISEALQDKEQEQEARKLETLRKT